MDESGIGYFTLTYPKTEAAWVTIRIQVTTEVFGTEYQELFDADLPISLEDAEEVDEAPPSGFNTSRYGTVANCNDPM